MSSGETHELRDMARAADGARTARPVNTVVLGDALEIMTSPPYFALRKYGDDAREAGQEPTPAAFVSTMVDVFREVRRVLKPTGTCWLNIADSYTGNGTGGDKGTSMLQGGQTNQQMAAWKRPSKTGFLPSKNLCLIPARLAIALQDDGWIVRDAVIWAKGREYSDADWGLNPMPGSQKDRCTSAYEFVLMLTKAPRYYFDWQSVAEPIRDSSIARLGQDVEAQAGSARANGCGKTNGTMKAVAFGGTKGGSSGAEARMKSGNAWSPRATKGYHAEAYGPGREHQQRAEDGKQFPNQSPLAMPRNVWPIPAGGTKIKHYATMPYALAEKCIKLGCPRDGVVLDPFAGAGTTLLAALQNGRDFIGVELYPQYIRMAMERMHGPLFTTAPTERTEEETCQK